MFSLGRRPTYLLPGPSGQCHLLCCFLGIGCREASIVADGSIFEGPFLVRAHALSKELERQKAADEEFSKARQLLVDLIQLPELEDVFDDEDCQNAKRVFTQAPTLLLLILQRLGGGLSLDGAVQELIKHHQDILPRNRRVEEGTLSQNSSAYNNARQNLPLQKVEAFARAICDHLAKNNKPVWLGRRVMILDGTTITLPPTPELKAAFPPATNQHGESVWPVAMLMVACELATGCALVPEIDAMYGQNNSSEAAQAERILDRLPHDSLVLATVVLAFFELPITVINATRNSSFV